MSRIKIVCCANMPFVEEAFSTLGETVIKDGRAICAGDVRDANLLVIRSTTKVNQDLLNGSRVKFVGTATIGTDHMDRNYLEANGITWMYSAGCNANSVSEYVTAALLRTAHLNNLTLEGKTIGIVGVGNVGSLVAQKARVLGLKTLLNDPPRARASSAGNNTAGDAFVELSELLAESDILTFHVPLTKDGRDPTWHMADAGLFKKLKKNCIFINSARGPVADTDALIAAIDNGTVAHSIIDTWEHEPGIRTDILQKTGIATPHIAGYSYDGKVMGTVMVYRAACRFLGTNPSFDFEKLLPPPVVPEAAVDCTGRKDEDVLNDLVSQVYDIRQDDSRLRTETAGGMAKHFDSLRKNYPVRREFRFTRVKTQNPSTSLLAKTASLGFTT